MNDLAPRGIDGFSRPAGPAGVPPAQPPAPQQPPQVRPQPVRPQQPVMRPQPPVPPRPVQPVVSPVRQSGASVPQPSAKPQQPASAKKGGWRVAIQFLIGLLIIAGVAAAIVMLYVRYYQ